MLLHVACLINYGLQQLAEAVNSSNGFLPLFSRYLPARGSPLPPADCNTSSADSGETRYQRNKLVQAQTLFERLFKNNCSFDKGHIERILSAAESESSVSLHELLAATDVDHYNLLEKATLYNNIEIARLLLDTCRQASQRDIANHRRLPERRTLTCGEELSGGLIAHQIGDGTPVYFGSAAHLAAFLGCTEILRELLALDGRAASVSGAVHVQPVTGPSNHLLTLRGYTSSCWHLDFDTIYRLNWVQTHKNELPIHFAICGDQAEAMDVLWSSPVKSTTGDPNFNQEVGDDILTPLFACASYKCLEKLLKLRPDILRRRDSTGRLYASYGLQHGTRFLKFLLELGLDTKLLNNIDGHGSMNALHVFYTQFSQEDSNFRKYYDLYEITETLLMLGVDGNMATDVFRGHRSETRSTCLHLLLDLVNLTMPRSSGASRAFSRADDIQERFDESVKDSIYSILVHGYSILENITSLLQRLFQNQYVAVRITERNKFCYLDDSLCGLRNLHCVAEMLLKHNARAKLEPRRRQMTSLLSLIDVLRDDDVFRYVFDHEEAFDMFKNCMELLLKYGDNPNVYPFSCNQDTIHAPVVIHFMDLYLQNLLQFCDHRALRLVDKAIEIVTSLCRNEASCTCAMNIGGQSIQHGVFDSFQPIFQSILQERRSSGVKLVAIRRLTHALVQYGAETKIHEFVRHARRAEYPGDAAGDTLLGQTLMLAMQCALIDEAKSRRTHLPIWYTQEYQDLFNFLVSEADHATFQQNLGHVLELVTDHVTNELHPNEIVIEIAFQLAELRESMTLQERCRSVIRNTWRTGYKSKVKRFPLPPALKRFLLFQSYFDVDEDN